MFYRVCIQLCVCILCYSFRTYVTNHVVISFDLFIHSFSYSFIQFVMYVFLYIVRSSFRGFFMFSAMVVFIILLCMYVCRSFVHSFVLSVFMLTFVCVFESFIRSSFLYASFLYLIMYVFFLSLCRSSCCFTYFSIRCYFLSLVSFFCYVCISLFCCVFRPFFSSFFLSSFLPLFLPFFRSCVRSFSPCISFVRFSFLFVLFSFCLHLFI